MKTYIIAGTLLSGVALCWAAKDPVLMTVNGNPVPVSEFEYLYNKNSQQQLAAQPVDEYLDLFEVYKLKVADAKAAGIDTTASFKKDMEGYRRDLAKPHLTDSAFINNMAKETYDRSREEVEATHIMIMKSDLTGKGRVLLDSLRTLALNGADFGDLAVEYSEDRSAKNNRGYYGYIPTGIFPLEFEKTAYSLKDGEISQVIESPFAYHILKGGKRRPARGQVLVSHIMKMVPPGSSAEDEAKIKAKVDSLYEIVSANPQLFAEIARSNSEDPGSASKGGELPWFGTGRMVPEFDAASFAMNVGEISKPVRSSYGWHIIYKRDAKGPESYEEVKQGVIRQLGNPQDERFRLNRENTTARLAKKHKGKINDKTIALLKERTANGADSVFYVECLTGDLSMLPVLSIGKKTYPVKEFIKSMRNQPIAEGERVAKILDNNSNNFLYNKLIETEEDWLDANNADYHNLLNEYREGSLLYEASVEKVWDRAAKDTEGLKAYFDNNKKNYAWSAPHVKGILVQAKNDSVADVVRKRMAEMSNDTIVPAIRKEFKGLATAERVLVEEGQNAMVDNIIFGAPAVTPSVSAYEVYFLWEPKVLTEPEEVSDVRGLVTGDYQNELERQWVEDLKSRYPVVVDDKVLKKLRKKYAVNNK